MTFKISYLPFFVLILATSCSGYEKVLKSTDYTLKYKKAKEYYQKKDYARASTLFEQIQAVYRATNKADTVEYMYAKSLFGQDDYIMAGHFFKEFTQNFQYSGFAEESEFMAAYCYYLMSPRPSLDQESTYSALQEFDLFMVKYPKSSRIEEAKKLEVELKEKLIDKSYLNAKLYYNLGVFKAAIIALNGSLIDFPETKYREELMFLLLKSKYYLADNSVEEKKKERYQNAVDEYYSFIAEFPQSKYLKEVAKIYESSMKSLKN
jgi:outer membrane protein assembly factor BamD